MSDNLASTARPVTDATITVRIIKSFRYRTEKSHVLHHIDLTKMTVGELKEIVRKVIHALGSYYWRILIFYFKLFPQSQDGSHTEM
jgi:hypothetical protein